MKHCFSMHRSPWQLSIVLALFLAISTSCGSRVPFRMRVLTYNIHHGEGLDGEIDLERLAHVIREAAPDLVALQEVDRGVPRSGGMDQLAKLARLTGLRALGSGHLPLEGGSYGNGILTRLGGELVETLSLPEQEEGEARAALIARLQPGDVRGPAEVLFIATHFDVGADESHRIAAVKRLERNVLAEPPAPPAILAGDLNSPGDSGTIEALERSWSSTTPRIEHQTYPADHPERQIDHIFFRPRDGWHVVAVKVIDEAVASDHRPLLAVLEWRGGPAAAGSRNGGEETGTGK